MSVLKPIIIHDLLRGARVGAETTFDFMREPILQGCGFNIGYPPGGKKQHVLLPGFCVETFRFLAGSKGESREIDWANLFYRIPDEARNYLIEHIPANALVLSFEMPPWLVDLCQCQNIPFLDVRISPLRFGRDLYISLRTSELDIYKRISAFIVRDEELRLEASMLSANVRRQALRLAESGRYAFDLDNSLIFIGQAPYDASLLSPSGQPLRCDDFSQEIKKLAKGRRLLYKPHPYAAKAGPREQAVLEAITGQTITCCTQNAYQILSADDDVELLSICSGMLQEAVWFDKPIHMLSQPFVPLAKMNAVELDSYQQVHHHTWLSPTFWHQMLTPERPSPVVSQLTSLPHHHARESWNLWWDYLKVMTWERSLPHASFERSGGSVLRKRIEKLELSIEGQGAAAAVPQVGSQELSGDSQHKFLAASLYSRLASAYVGLDEAFSKNISPPIYKKKDLGARYYQQLHDTHALFKGNNWLMPYLDFIKSQAFSHVREVGCGNGAFVAEISKSVKRVVGLDWAKAPNFPEAENIEFSQEDLTEAELEKVDLNCSADVLEHIETCKLPAVIKTLHASARYNFHVIACYDDRHSHLSILPPDVWLYLFRRESYQYKIMDLSIRHNDISHVVCVVTNI